MISHNREIAAHTWSSKDVKKFLMRRFESKNVNDSLDKLIIIGFQKFSDDKVVILQNLIKSRMDSIFLVLNSVVQNDMEPLLADINLCNRIIFNYLPNQIVSSIEDFFECFIFDFGRLIYFFQYFFADVL